MKTTEEAYTEYICPYCGNDDVEQCEIRTRIDNTTYCDGYKREKKAKPKTPRNWQSW